MLVLASVGCNKAGKLNEPSKAPAPSSAVEFKLKWPTGERVVQSMDMKSKSETTLPGRTTPMKQDMTMVQKYALTVLRETATGGHEVEMEFLSAKMGTDMGGKNKMAYDSTKTTDADKKNPMAGVFGKIIGSKIKYFMDASNNVERVEGVEELMKRISSGGSAAAAAPLKGMFNDGYFKQLMSSVRFLPTKPVSPGDSWPVQIEYPMGMMGTLVMDYTFTFEKWELHGKRNCARMEFQGTVKSKPGETPSTTGMSIDVQNGSISGTSWFDPELGITIDTTMNQDMTMAMTFPQNPRAKSPAAGPQIMTSQISQTINIKLDSVK